jgi:hypothetical protein
MEQTNTRSNRILVKLLGIMGMAAFAAMAVLGISYGSGHFGSGTALAGSGNAPANTTYVQPSVIAATMGATATWTTPEPTLATAKAVPVVRAGG